MSITAVLLFVWLTTWAMTFMPPVVLVVDRVGIGPPGCPAFALLCVVIAKPFWAKSTVILRHEFAHLRQQRILGGPFVFLAVYFLSWLPGWIRSGNIWKGYEESIFETWSNRASLNTRKQLPFYFKIDLTTKAGRFHSFGEETLMDENKQKPTGLEGSEAYRAFREKEYQDYQESLKKQKLNKALEETEVQTTREEVSTRMDSDEDEMPKEFFEEMTKEANETREFFVKKQALKEAKKADFQKKLQAFRNKKQSKT